MPILLLPAVPSLEAALESDQFLILDLQRIYVDSMGAMVESMSQTQPDMVIVPADWQLSQAAQLRQLAADEPRILLGVERPSRVSASDLLPFDGIVDLRAPRPDLRQLLLPWHTRERPGTRGTRRTRLRRTVRLHFAQTSLDGVSVDVSRLGAGLLVAGDVSPSTPYSIEIEFDNAVPLKRKALVRWVRGRLPVRIGVEWLNPNGSRLSRTSVRPTKHR